MAISKILTIFFMITSTSILHSFDISHNGQVSSWITNNKKSTNLSARYVPEFNIKNILNKNMLDSEVSFIANEKEPKFYRCYLRYVMSQADIRFGLQKINFGQSKILRALNWFETPDIRDPFELVDGVNAFLFRYFFLNNFNIWTWATIDEEYGLRCETPIYKGELAFSYNYDSKNNLDKYALDGMIDIGVGLWGEFVSSSQDDLLTVGLDYTIDPGIHVMYERFSNSTALHALSLSYNFNIMDNIQIIGYYNNDTEKLYSHVGLQRSYDNWQFNLIGFSNEENINSEFRGLGIQFIVTYNY